ncbi:MAG: ATP-binding cassette domain-containing protein, partial [Bacteroidia bacterium]|nr:ATP-binding cassette domain-containing protein [Bacteroidia bacterium]
MSKVVIKVENIGKQYRLGQVGTSTMSADVKRWISKLKGKGDPFLKIGEENDRTLKSQSDLVWAIKDINFDVKQGEVLGIIGKNGAGKSTLLKVLSRVTAPTVGDIKVKGRIASLLEVGTGFHPDLTGRENIFLNGAILGMTKREIKSKFDEIVDFSGVERYIDTPVKRYSSGMYVRLAFAVAAHLEPEILIVDEVLAVGDAEFQKKCLGKMKDVSGQGRTVLFVSHNMEAVKNLTQNSVVLKNGRLIYSGDTGSAVNQYLRNNDLKNNLFFDSISEAIGNEFIKVKSVQLVHQGEHLKVDTEFKIEIQFFNSSDFNEMVIGFDLIHVSGANVFSTGKLFNVIKNSLNTVVCTIPANLLNNDIYGLNLMFFTKNIMP